MKANKLKDSFLSALEASDTGRVKKNERNLAVAKAATGKLKAIKKGLLLNMRTRPSQAQSGKGPLLNGSSSPLRKASAIIAPRLQLNQNPSGERDVHAHKFGGQMS